ncbi:MAG: hypothetical protein AMXMBFR78_11650 [Rubrivivax sp.]
MATSLVAAPAAGTPLVHISPQLRALYAARGMWVNGTPQGWLSTQIGARESPGSNWFFASAAQVRELMRDLAEKGRQVMSPAQLGQLQRRLREALVKAGEAGHWPASTAAAGAPAAAPAHNPFEPLVVPPAGRAREAFLKHVGDCVRDLVDYSQSSAYGPQQPSAPPPDQSLSQRIIVTDQITILPLAALRESPFNPRRDYPEASLLELAESIASHGQADDAGSAGDERSVDLFAKAAA